MVKSQEKLGQTSDKNGMTLKKYQKKQYIETPSYDVEKEQLMEPKIVQPLLGRTPYIKPVELGGGAQWPSKPVTTTLVKSPGNAVEQSPTKSSQKPTAGRRATRDDQEEEQPPPSPPPRGNGRGGGDDGNGGNGGNGDGDDDSVI